MNDLLRGQGRLGGKRKLWLLPIIKYFQYKTVSVQKDFATLAGLQHEL